MRKSMKNTVAPKIGAGLIGTILVLGVVGCANTNKKIKERKTVAPPPIERKTRTPQEYARFVHRIKWSGETLSVIAKWYTGKHENWKALVKVNPNLDPKRIYVGQKIFIPEELLKTRKPMPLEFLAKFRPKPKKKTSPPKKSHTRLQTKEKTKALEKSARFVHRVKWPKETLLMIAKWYTGKHENWRVLAKSNPNLASTNVVVGARIFIPEDLVKTRKAMPLEFMAKYLPKPKKKTPVSEAVLPPGEKNEPTLFGPRQYPSD